MNFKNIVWFIKAISYFMMLQSIIIIIIITIIVITIIITVVVVIIIPFNVIVVVITFPFDQNSIVNLCSVVPGVCFELPVGRRNLLRLHFSDMLWMQI